MLSCLALISDPEDGGNMFLRNINVREEIYNASSNIELQPLRCMIIVLSGIISDILWVIGDLSSFRHNCTPNIQEKELERASKT
jgi:hypothetical protein